MGKCNKCGKELTTEDRDLYICSECQSIKRMSREHLRLSPSKIDTYLNCGELYRRRYICNEIIPPGMALLRGSSVHKGLEVNHKQKIESKVDIPKSQILDVISAHFDNMKNKQGFSLNKDEQSAGAEKSLGQTKDDAIKLGGLYSDEIAPSIIPASVEDKIEIKVSDNVTLVTVIDLTTAEEKIKEFKTGKRRTQEWADSDRQLTFESLAYKAKHNKQPKGIEGIILVNNKTPVVQTLRSYRSKDDYEVMINCMNTVIDGLTKGVFMPANSGWWGCSPVWCGYYSTCKYVSKRRIK